MSFKTQAEIYQFLLNGAKLRHQSYDKNQYIHLVNGCLCGVDGTEWREYFVKPSGWSLYEEPKKVTLYRYTYEENGGIVSQTTWNNVKRVESYFDHKILKTETKEVEI